MFGCDDGGAGACDPDNVDLSCSPLFEPSWDKIYDRVILPSCSTGGSSCHAVWGKQGGLDLSDSDVAYRSLVEDGRALPGDPGGSSLVWRLEGNQGGVMPPGAPLDESAICAVKQWIANGATR